MGSLCHINPDPRTWPCFMSGKKLRPELGGDELLQVTYGTFDDYPESETPLEALIRQGTYDGLLSGAYRVDRGESHRNRRLIILKSDGGAFMPVEDGLIY